MSFDIDGTLVDTNPSHVEAWRRAFKRFGFDIPAARVKVEIASLARGSQRIAHYSLLHLRSSAPMTTSEETDWMNHPAIRALVDQANTLALEERITLVKGLIPAIADALSEDEYEQFVTFVRLKGERFLEAKSHPGTGRAERHTPGDRELEGR